MLHDHTGAAAVVGRSEGFWAEESDFVATRADFKANEIGPHGFPRDWPGVYSSSRALKSLLGKKGSLHASRVYVAQEPPPAALAKVASLELTPCQSWQNAEAVAKQTGMAIERGWAVYELFKSDGSTNGEAEFVAQKHWFNRTADGEPVDFTPRAPAVGSNASAGGTPLLLVEVAEATEKERKVLALEHTDLHMKLLTIRGFKPPAAPRSAKACIPPPSRKITPLPVESSGSMPGMPPSRKIEPAKPTEQPAADAKSQPKPAAVPPAAKEIQKEAVATSTSPARVESTVTTGRLIPASPPKLKSDAVASKPPKRSIDYSKFDAIEDSDEEKEKPKDDKPDMSKPTVRIIQTPTEHVTLADYRLCFKALLDKADPPTVMPDLELMFKAFKACPDTTDRSLLDQACHVVEGIPHSAMLHGLDGWKNGTAQMTQAMLQRQRYDEARMWCVIRRMKLPGETEILHMHAWCLEEQWAHLLNRGEDKVRMPTLEGSKLVDVEEYAEALQECLRAMLRKTLDISKDVVPAPAYAGLVASLERSGDLRGARQVAREGTKKGVWANQWQRPAHFVRSLLPQQGWHDTSTLELCAALEQAADSVREEFEKYMAGSGGKLKNVGIRSGEALLVERGSWKELPLFSAGRMDHEVCSRFPETVRILTERCADATGLAFCGGGEIAFRILEPGTKLKPHTGPTNARLSCQLGIHVPLGAEPGITVADNAARPWIQGKCVVYDDSFEHYEELDEMAEGDCVVLLAHFWHPAFQHKNDPEWKVKGMQENADVPTTPGDSTATAAKLFTPMPRDTASAGTDDLPPID